MRRNATDAKRVTVKQEAEELLIKVFPVATAERMEEKDVLSVVA